MVTAEDEKKIIKALRHASREVRQPAPMMGANECGETIVLADGSTARILVHLAIWPAYKAVLGEDE
jgi:hypothetical protein